LTLLFGVVSCCCILLLGGFARDLNDASADRARAQRAADAAALAAIAEVGPYGRGAGMHVARRYAELNGAELLSCSCDAAAPGVQVTVAVDGVVARARAVFDARLLGPLAIGAGAEGLHPVLRAAVDQLLHAGRGAIHVTSGLRSTERQAQLWNQALAVHGSAEAADDWVAPPGSSMHERGLAVDLGGDVQLAARLVADMGLPLHRPLPNEPWHFELVGTRS